MPARPPKAAPLITPDSGIVQQLGEILRRSHFTVAAITGLLGDIRLTEIKSRSPRLLYAARGDSPLNTLIRLFVAGVPVERKQAEAALNPLPLAALARTGVLRAGKKSVTPLVSILPHDDLVVASDQPYRSGASADYVPSIMDSSMFLELFTVRRPFTNALDLGSGTGVQSLRAALHCDRVIAVDSNARAIEFTRFNAALNGVENIEAVCGSGFDATPLDLEFDLIVSNLPFVISPGLRYIYRDSGMPLDGFARAMIGEAPAHLTDGGYAQFLCQWVELQDQDWRDRLQEWFQGNGCDVWVMKNDTMPPDAYAEKWIADTEPCPPEEAALLFEQWMEFYDSERVTAIHSGAIAMRKRAGSNWLRMDEGPERARSVFGDAILRAFALQDFLQQAGNEVLLDVCLRISPDVHLLRRSDWSDGAWQDEACQLRFHHEMEYVANVDRYVSNLVAQCNGERPLRRLIEEMAGQTGLAADRLTPAILALVRGLIERGFLLPGHNAGS